MSYVKLYALPESQPWTLDRFLDEIKHTCREAAKDLHRVSMMVEDAVEDLIFLAVQSLNMDDDGDGDQGQLQSPPQPEPSRGSSMQTPEESGDEEKPKQPQQRMARQLFKNCVEEATAAEGNGNGSSKDMSTVSNMLQVRIVQLTSNLN